MNVKLLKQVRDYIARHPEKYDQSQWCGSACCVAGTTMFVARQLTRKKMEGQISVFQVMCRAAQILGLDSFQADRLFSATWTYIAGGQFMVNPDMDPVERSKIAVKRINHFIRTKGAE